ncbi:MAG: hypothetical protein IRY85_06805 [Micromonosporaceae bacterium]|nr:hypothetical protein [Micromonosporaceae bacterium]
MNTLAIRIDLSESPSFTTLLRRIRQRVFGALAHQEVPFEQVVQELRVPRDLGRMPVFQVVFALQTTRARPAPGRKTYTPTGFTCRATPACSTCH